MARFFKSVLFILSALILSASIASADSGRIYFTTNNADGGSVCTANPDGTGIANIGNLGGLLQAGAAGLAIDQVQRKLYVQGAGGALIKANLDGTDAVTVCSFNDLNPYNLFGPDAFYVINGKLYALWEFKYNPGGSPGPSPAWYYWGCVVVANADGTGAVTYDGLGDWACGLGVDTVNNKLNVSSYAEYWSPGWMVQQINMDGSGEVRLSGLDGLLCSPMGIAMDNANRKMYIVNNAYYNPSAASVTQANLDGTGAVNLGNLNGLVSYPVSIALNPADGKMYVKCLNASWNNERIIEANLDGTGAVQLNSLNNIVAGFDVLPASETAFASFVSKVDIDAADGKFDSNSTFTLGAGSNGIKPVSENITFQVGESSLTIPAGSFKQIARGKYAFSGMVGSTAVEAQIAPAGNNSYAFRIEAAMAGNLPTENPVKVTLSIGDDGGSASVAADIQ